MVHDDPHTIVSAVIPFRPGLIDLLPAPVWGALETSLALVVTILAFVQKSEDHTNSAHSAVGLFSYVALVLKSSFAVAVAFDGLYASATNQSPRPFSSCLLLVLIVDQIRSIVHVRSIRRIVTGCGVISLVRARRGIVRVK